jgi:F-type H+-transporting ATPase subunit epsilon
VEQTTSSVNSKQFLLEIVTPGVLPGHCLLLSSLRIGELQYKIGETTESVSILSGLAEVTPTRVTILADVAEKAEEIDIERAQAALQRAEEHLERGGLPSEVEEAKVSLEKARLRKKIAERFQQRRSRA